MTLRARFLLALAALFLAGLVTGILVATNVLSVREAAAGFQQAVLSSVASGVGYAALGSPVIGGRQ